MPAGKKPKRRAPTEKALRVLNLMMKPEDERFQGQPNDIVIPVMGPTGVGKSTFINSLLGEEIMKVGHGLKSETSHLQPYQINIPPDSISISDSNGRPRRLIIVDTPGFDDTFVDDSEILRRISVWLALSYADGMKLGAVIYLHDISQTRMLGTTRRNLDMFRRLVGNDALSAVVLGTTKWGSVGEELAERRQTELQQSYWADMFNAGSQIIAIRDPKESSQVLTNILKNTDPSRLADQFLTIQEELAALKKYIPETEAGKTLRYTLAEVIEMQQARAEKLKALAGQSNDNKTLQEFRDGQKRLENLVKTAKDMKLPFSARLKRLFA